MQYACARNFMRVATLGTVLQLHALGPGGVDILSRSAMAQREEKEKLQSSLQVCCPPWAACRFSNACMQELQMKAVMLSHLEAVAKAGKAMERHSVKLDFCMSEEDIKVSILC